MSWNIFIKRLLAWLLIAAGIGIMAYLLYRSADIHLVLNGLLIAIGFFIAVWVFILVARFLSLCLQNNFVLTVFIILALIYLAMRYQVFNDNPYLNGYIQQFQEFQENYNNKLDELDRLMRKQGVSPEAGSQPTKLPEEF